MTTLPKPALYLTEKVIRSVWCLVLCTVGVCESGRLALLGTVGGWGAGCSL